MRLKRVGTSAHESLEDSVHRAHHDGEVQLFYRAFGSGNQAASTFVIGVSWDDVEKLIVEFAAMNNPDAIHLLQAKSLAIAATRAGWYPTPL